MVTNKAAHVLKTRKDYERLAEIVRLFLLGVTPHEVARRMGCSAHEILEIVERHRLRTALPVRQPAGPSTPLGDPASCAPSAPVRNWVSRELLADLGRASAAELARRYGVSEQTVLLHRRRAGISLPKKYVQANWTPQLDEMLGRYSDRYVARRAGIHIATVAKRRRRLGRRAVKRSWTTEWTPEAISWLGKRPDKELARVWGLYLRTVSNKRITETAAARERIRLGRSACALAGAVEPGREFCGN